MSRWFFVSDLHGRPDRYRTLLERIAGERPPAVLLGGDLLPHALDRSWAPTASEDDFVAGFLLPELRALAAALGPDYPRVLLILGNDDPKAEEAGIRCGETEGLWQYVHMRRVGLASWSVYGYVCVPPTPFLLKDWERYDVSRYIDPGCLAPEEGRRSVPADSRDVALATIEDDLHRLAARHDLDRAVFLFHSPPYRTRLDRAALDGRTVDHVPVDVNVGSIAIRRFIESRRPRVTLHGHVHESARLTGAWRDRIGPTHLFSAAHDGPELALVRFDPDRPDEAERELA
jgi:Icc-related predicted phosphoesterase